MWTNSKTIVKNYGASLGLNYSLHRHISIMANASFSKLKSVVNNDGFEEAFNTPRWMVNIGLNQSGLTKNMGICIHYKYQEGFLWQSALATGFVREIHTVDAQCTYYFRQQGLQIKLAGTNILNRPYISFLGGPTVGTFYYLTLTAELPAVLPR
ncbi:MAG: outer membrane beta-barrel protein [Spirosomataceae bacterium]